MLIDWHLFFFFLFRSKAKRLRILQEPPQEAVPIVRKDSAVDEDLTLDEVRAVELSGALRKKKKSAEMSSDEEEEEEAEDVEQGEDKEGEGGDEGERRLITRQIEKNKGLTPKRSKLQRNPRVKHRVKFQKAKVRRKGQVREVRTEVKKYAGELSGINARVKKGIKLA